MERTTVHATLLKTSEIMKHSALGRNTVRFYEDKGLIKPSHRTSAGYRMYSGETLHDLEFIKHAKAAGLSLDQIKDLLTLGRADSTTCGVVAKKIEARIADVNLLINNLQRQKSFLVTFLDTCKSNNAANRCDIRGNGLQPSACCK